MAAYRKLKTGWQFRVSYKENGKYKEKTGNGFKTKTEAKLHAEKIEQQLKRQERNGSTASNDSTFYDYFKEWYSIYKEPHISDITKRKYETTQKQVQNYFGALKLKDLKIDHYQKFINDYGSTRALSSTRKINHQLKSCLNHAEHIGLIESNPTYNVKLTGNAAKEETLKYLDESDVKKLTKALLQGYNGSQTGRAMCLFALNTGCRLGEVMALTEDKIDRKKMIVTIDRSWDYKITQTFSSTKTDSSVRKIAIDQQTINIIDTCSNYYKKMALRTGQRNTKNLIFITKDFSPISSNGVDHALKKALNRAGIKKVITFHGLRHTHASLLLLNGIDIGFVAKRLGHKNTIITSEIYAHVLKETEDKGNNEVALLAKNIYN